MAVRKGDNSTIIEVLSRIPVSGYVTTHIKQVASIGSWINIKIKA